MKRVALLFVLSALLLPVYFAGAAENVLIEPQRSSVKANANEYLIGLLPPQGRVDIDKNLRDASPRQLRAAVAERQAESLLQELRQLQARGEILGFVLDPDQYAVRVWANDALPALHSEAGMVAPAEQELPACAEGLADAVVDMARASLMTAEVPMPGSRSVTDAPTISISISPPYYNSFSYVSGLATPDSEITMRIYRNGSLYQGWRNTVQPSGYYQMYPSWVTCPQSGYVWYIQPGDVIEMEDTNGTSRMTVAPIVGTLDPVTMVVEGQTLPNQTVHYSVSAPTSNNEWIYMDEQTTQSDANGHFRATYNSAIGSVSRRAGVSFYVEDINGNFTLQNSGAFSLAIDPAYNNIWGRVNRSVQGTVDLIRGGNRIAQERFISSETGFFDIYFGEESFLPGDVLTVNDGRQTISTTVSPWDAKLDAATDKLTITAAPGRSVEYYTYKLDYYDGILQNSCSFQYDSGFITTGSNGTVNASLAMDLGPGDYSDLYLYDEQGNTQYPPTSSVPTIVAGPGSSGVRGYWHKAYVTLDIRLYDSANKQKSAITSYASYDGGFYDWFDVLVAAGDRIKVSQGGQTRTMVVSDAGGRLNSVAQNLTVSGPNRPYLATYTDYDGFFYDSSDCYEKTISGGSSVTNLDGRVSPGDYAQVFMLDADDNYTRLDLSALKINVTQGTPLAYMSTELPGGSVRVTHRRGSNNLFSHTYVADGTGFLWFESDSVFQPGDILIVNADSTPEVQIQIHEATANIDAANNRVYGVAPTGRLLEIELFRIVNGYGSALGFITIAESDGRYSADFSWSADLYIGGSYLRPCLSLTTSDRCATANIGYLTPEGHEVWTSAGSAPPAPADKFENDNTATTAKPYEGGTQTHTFHTTTDVDWVKVTFPSQAVGRPVRFVVSNMGWDVAVDMDLYRPNGTTRITNTTLEDPGRETWLVWTPDQAGTFYLRVSPLFDDVGGHCDSFYDLRIDFAQVSLPVVIR